MPSEAHTAVPVCGRHLDALRTLAICPRGLRHNAYPSAMPVLRELGYVEERPMRGRGSRVLCFITPAGRDILEALGERRTAEN